MAQDADFERQMKAHDRSRAAKQTGWETIETGSEIHVLPESDFYSHSLRLDCSCFPKYDTSEPKTLITPKRMG